MSLASDLNNDVDSILGTRWETRDGEVIPEAEDVRLGNDAVKLKGTVLYADLAESTGLVNRYNAWFAANVYKSYLVCASKIIRANHGKLTAFDGDRVMAVFAEANPNTSAAKSALQIKYAVDQLINPKIKAAYPDASYLLRQAVGIDTSELFVAKTGIRGANDLVWVGRAANLAAKMCSLREGEYASYITADVFKKLHESVKYGGNPRQLMWEEVYWKEQEISIYRSSWRYRVE